MLSASIKTPLLSSQDSTLYQNILDSQSESLSMSKAATIGYDSMSFNIVSREPETRDWITNGLGRHIEVYAPSGRVWEGFLNEINLSLGATTLTIGPLLDVRNKIKVAYTTKRWDTNPPIGGDPAETAFNSDSESVAKWGTFEEILSGGEGYAATMTSMRDSKLVQSAWPKLSQDFSSGSSGSGVLSLSFLGYYHMLGRYLYDDATALSAEEVTTAKLGAVLDADPDSLFSSANSDITATTLDVPRFDDGTRYALDIVRELIGIGYSSNRRALFSVGNDRFVTMEALETDKESVYTYDMYDSTPSILRNDGSPVMPWDIRTGEWVKMEALSAEPFSTSLPKHSNPEYMFIESVTYSAPDSISIQGGLGNTFSDKIGRLGIEFARG